MKVIAEWSDALIAHHILTLFYTKKIVLRCKV